MEDHLQSALRHLRALRDEIDGVLARLDPTGSPKPAVTPAPSVAPAKPNGRVSDIFEPVVLAALVERGKLSSREIAALLPGTKRVGPIINAWRLRAQRAGHDYLSLVTKSSGGPEGSIFTLTEKGRQLLAPIAAVADVAPSETERSSGADAEAG